jgi:glycosyltransferase involved in cell wall biosynthesis
MHPQPKVSIAVLTYNHERYVAQALQGAVTQRTNFPFEIVVAEDCSTDRTRDIVLQFQAAHPGLIRSILNPVNIGADANVKNLIASCKGEYIALLEADDAWTSEDKLQLQVDFLDSHPECSICYHPVLHVFEDGSKPPAVIPPRSKPIATIEDLLTSQGNFIPTCSVMFRSGPHTRIPDWTRELGFADWPLHVMNARAGHIGFLPQCMGIYRAHSGGTWSTLSRRTVVERWMRAYEYMNAELGYRYNHLIANTAFKWRFAYAVDAIEQQEEGAREILWKTVSMRPRTAFLDKKALLLLKYYAPFVIRALGGARRTVLSLVGAQDEA